MTSDARRCATQTLSRTAGQDRTRRSRIFDGRNDIPHDICRLDGRRIRRRLSRPAESEQVLLGVPALEDVDSTRIERICRLYEVKATFRLTSLNNGLAVRSQKSGSVIRIKGQAAGDDQHDLNIDT